MKRRIGFGIASLCAALASLQIVHAETLTVINNGDDGGGTQDLFLDTVTPDVGPNVNVSREHLNESETQIAINPANPLNLFAVSNHDYEHLTPPRRPTHLWGGLARPGSRAGRYLRGRRPGWRGPQGFGTAQRVTSTNWGWSVPVRSAYNFRRTFAEPFLAYDNSSGPFSGRLYLSYLDSPEVLNPHSYVNLRYLDDGATIWSPPIRASTGGGDLGTAFMPSISVDPISGLVGATWYDSDEVDGNLANLFAAFSDTGGQTFSRSVRLSRESSRADRSTPRIPAVTRATAITSEMPSTIASFMLPGRTTPTPRGITRTAKPTWTCTWCGSTFHEDRRFLRRFRLDDVAEVDHLLPLDGRIDIGSFEAPRATSTPSLRPTPHPRP